MAYGSFVYGQHLYKGVVADVDPPLTTEDYFVERPNWEYGVDVSYFMRTAVRQSRKLVESRKPLRGTFARTERFSVTLKGDDAQDFEHFIEEKHAGIFYIPIFTEPSHPSGSGSLIGLSQFTVTDDLDQFYNLNELTQFVMLIDLLDQVITEVIPYASNTDTDILLDANIAGAFQKETTVVFPCMVAYLSKVSIADRTDDTIEIEMTYKEKF